MHVSTDVHRVRALRVPLEQAVVRRLTWVLGNKLRSPDRVEAQ